MNSSPATRRSLTTLGRAGLAVTAATVAANLLAYLPPVLAAHRLPPPEFGALAAALAVVAIATMPGVGLQTAVAVAIAGSPPGPARSGGPAGATRAAWLTALACGGVVLLATPALASVLRLPLALPPLLAAMTVPAVLAGLPLGLLQGSERFGRLALGTVALAIGRYVGLIAGLIMGIGLTGAFALGALAAWSVLPAMWWFATPPTSVDGGVSGLGVGVRGRAVFTAASASLAILVASYADLILARWLLSPGDSGAYAIGAVLTRAAIWGPQVVTIVALPRLVRSGAAVRVGLALVVAAGVLLVGGSVLAGDLLIRAAGGDRYSSLRGFTPYFIVIGVLYSITVFLLNALIATGARRPAAAVWTVVLGLVVTTALVRPATVGQLLACSLTAATATAVLTSARGLSRSTSRPRRTS